MSTSRLAARRIAARCALAVTVTAGAVVASSVASASAAVPTFPDNLVVFPDRDFVTVEGFQQHVGGTAILEVLRGGAVVGSARSVVAPGDVAFEVNHPGGVCWGAGTSLAVTPDIVAGDTVRVRLPDGTSADTTVQDAAVTADSTLVGATLTITGRVGPGVSTDQMEQRIVNPDLADTAVGRRDVRALPGPLTPSDKGGYSSGLAFGNGTFTATYVFEDAAVARIAAEGGGERAMAWEQQDADGNRQGLSIAEYGELGGPGFGGCPAGPADQPAPAGSFSAVRSASDGSVAQVSWTPASAAPGATAVDGYSVVAIASTAGADGRVQLGKRTGAGATRTTITGLDPAGSYTFEVRSTAGARMSEPFTAVSAPAPTDPPPADQTPPTVTADPAPAGDTVVEASRLTLTTEAGADIYFTTDGTPASTGDLPSDSARLYTGPIPITERTEVRWVAFDRAGNGDGGFGSYAPPAAPVTPPTAPADLAGTVGQESVTLRWSAATDPSVTAYRVQAYVGGAARGAAVETTARTVTLSGLTAGTSYGFTVAAMNGGGYGVESAQVGPFVPTAVTDRITVTTARWKAGDFRVVGTGSAVGATVSVRTGSASGPVIGRTVVTAPVAPATIGDYSFRARDAAAPRTNPGQIWVTSSNGGVTGPFTVTR